MARVLYNSDKNAIANVDDSILNELHIIRGDDVGAIVLGEKEEECEMVYGRTLTLSEDPLNAPVTLPIRIEEENSCDNFPAIGHLDRFEITTAEDGTLLPSTVNAKMADGSYQRLTLYPQIVDGNVTCTVQFDNFHQEKQTDPSHGAILDKIDKLILQNEDIVKSSNMPGRAIKPVPGPILKERVPQRPTILPASRKRPINVTQIPAKRNQFSVIQPNDIKSHNSRSVLKRVCLQQPVESLPTKESAVFDIQPNIPISSNGSFTSLLNSSVKFRTLPKLVNRVISVNQIRPKNPEDTAKPVKLTVNPPRKLAMAMPSTQATCIASIGSSPPAAAAIRAPSPVPRNDVFVKSAGYLPKDDNNTNPLGSSSNPITLIQDGQVYQSKQPLSDDQLRQISAILKKHKNNLTTSEDFLVDPATKTRILYKVVYPDEKSDDGKPVLTKSIGKKSKRGRKKQGITSPSGTKCNKIELAPSTGAIDDGPVEKTSAELAATEENVKVTSMHTKVIQLSRTRSGRLSRPPKHMVKDYKRIDPGPDIGNKADIDRSLMDYQNIQVPPPLLSVTPPVPINQYLSHRTFKKAINVKSDYRCPTCKKIYLGHKKMIHHLRKFPHHSSLSEYSHALNNQRPPVKSQWNKRKLMRMVSSMDRSVYGPVLAKAFNTWDFLLLQVGLMDKTGTNEVELILHELYGLLEKLSKVLEELLVPAYNNENGKDTCVHLDKMEIAYVLGMPQGLYKLNPDQLHLLRLDDNSPTQPNLNATSLPPPPPQLATKFEPNLSNKLLECSNDSIDLDCSSKDVEMEDDKKDWVSDRVEDTNSEFLSEFLENELPSGPDEGLALWKDDARIIRDTTELAEGNPWKKTESNSDDQPEMWKDGESPCAANNVDLWKRTKADKDWSSAEGHRDNWKEEARSVWESNEMSATRDIKNDDGTIWSNKESHIDHSETWGKSEKWESPTLRQWKDENVVTAVPVMRTSRLTSTPETASTLFSPPLRRNSVSGFVPANQEELLSLDLHELFNDLIPEQTKPQPKPGSIESIINEALFPGNEPPPSHNSIPPLIPDTLDEFGFS